MRPSRRTAAARAALAAVALGACSGAARGRRGDEAARCAPDPQAGEARAGAARSAVPAPPALVQRLDAVAQRVGAQVARYQGVVAAGFITEHANVTTVFDVPAGQCLSILAVTSNGIGDLDARLYAPDGDLVVEDTEPDAHPTVQLCANEARRVYHVIEAYQGNGAYAIATFATDRRGLDAVARVVGGRPGTAASGAATASDAERRLAELREGIVRRGFTPTGDLVRAMFPAAGALRYPLQVTPDRCYTIAALADGTLADTDVSVFDPDGEEVARDVRPERDAFVQLCPAAAATLTIEVRARPGPGVVLLQPFAADAGSVGGANTLWLGERVAWGASATPLAQSVEATRAQLTGLGYAVVGQPAPQAFAPGEFREAPVTIEAGRCTAVALVAGRGVGRVSLALHDAAGDLVARGQMRGAAAVAVVCPAAREALSARMRVEVGAGDAQLQAFGGAAIPPWAAQLDRVAASEALAAFVATAQGAFRAEGTAERLRLGARAVRSREFDLAPGTCTRFAVSAGRGLPVVALALRVGAATVAQASAEGTAYVTRCARGAERVRLDATVEPGGAAEYDAVLQRFVRPDRAQAER